MYQYTSKGYKFVEYEAPEPPRNRGAYDRIFRAIVEKAKQESLRHPDRLIKCPYKRSDWQDAWGYGLDAADDELNKG